MPFLRFNRDRRGYESTFLLHARGPGERPDVLYWYRTAPGVRVGRPALDEEAIRIIEAQHTDMEFDWPAILEVGGATSVEEERDLPRPRRALSPAPHVEFNALSLVPPPPIAPRVHAVASSRLLPSSSAAASPPATSAASDASHSLLEELVGRENAARLQSRFAEISALIEALQGDQAETERLRTKARALNPTTWLTPSEILAGVQRAASMLDDLRREISAPSALDELR